MATQSLDPQTVKVLATKYWNHFAIQLGHWNPMKVIIMDDEMFRLMSYPVKIEVAREMIKYLREDVMYARDADNEEVWILGPKKLMQPSISVVDNIPIWDPKKKHAAQEIKIPRPPNAYILYRKDKHNEVKAENPGLHNNEISVITGAMWKGESPEVRAKYHEKAEKIKAQLMALYPNYRYTPRKPSEIRRRTRRSPITVNFVHNAHKSPSENLRDARISTSSQITRFIPGAQQFLPPVQTPGWTPYHLVNGTNAQAAAATQVPVGEDHSAHNTPVENGPNMEMNVDPEYEATVAAVDRFMESWDIEADLAQMMAEI